MDETSCEAVVRRWFEQVWNTEDGERNVPALRAPDARSYGLGDAEIDGVDPYVVWVRAVKRVLSDIRVTVEQTVSDGRHVAARLRFTARHGAQTIDISGMGIIEVKDGRILRAWNQWDVAGLLVQTGLSHGPTTLGTAIAALAKHAVVD